MEVTSLFNQLPIDRHLGCFHFVVVIISKLVANIIIMVQLFSYVPGSMLNSSQALFNLILTRML